MRQKPFTQEQRDFIITTRQGGETHESVARLFNAKWPDRQTTAYVVASVSNRSMVKKERHIPKITLCGPVWSVEQIPNCQHVRDAA